MGKKIIKMKKIVLDAALSFKCLVSLIQLMFV